MIDLLDHTPNDVFDWRAGRKTVVPHSQRWRTLNKQKTDIQTRLRELPLDKLEKLGEMLTKAKERGYNR